MVFGPPVTVVFGVFAAAAGIGSEVVAGVSGLRIVFGSSGGGNLLSGTAPEDFVPSIHCTVSGAQSSSSSSMSAHFASLPASSACRRVAR